MVLNAEQYVAAGCKVEDIHSSTAERAKDISKAIILHLYGTKSMVVALKTHRSSTFAESGELITRDQLMTYLQPFAETLHL